MTDYFRTALLLEEQASKLPRDNPRRAYLIGLAKATRQVGLEQAAAERKQGIIDKLVDEKGLSKEEAEFLYEIAARFGRRGFYFEEISDMRGGEHREIESMVCNLQGKGALMAAIGEDETAYALDVLFRWIVARLEA